MHILADENIPLVDEFFAGFGEIRRMPGRSINRAALENVDVLLVSAFEDKASLDAYQQHPQHKAVSAELGAMRQTRSVLVISSSVRCASVMCQVSRWPSRVGCRRGMWWW